MMQRHLRRNLSLSTTCYTLVNDQWTALERRTLMAKFDGGSLHLEFRYKHEVGMPGDEMFSFFVNDINTRQLKAGSTFSDVAVISFGNPTNQSKNLYVRAELTVGLQRGDNDYVLVAWSNGTLGWSWGEYLIAVVNSVQGKEA